MNITQKILHSLEEGEGRIIRSIVPLLVTLGLFFILYDLPSHWVPVVGTVGGVYRGLNDAQSMDNAQLARQIATGHGFTTKFIRPFALTQLNNRLTAQSLYGGTSAGLFPESKFPRGAPRILPDTYNAPGYPYLLAAWFRLCKPAFTEPFTDLAARHMYSADRCIPGLNQIFLILTALLVFALGRRVFEPRVGWIALVAFLACDLVWQFSITGLSTSVLMFLVTAVLYAAVEIFCVGEACFLSEEASFAPAWIWTAILGFVLGLACLTRLHLLVLLLPVGVFFLSIPRARFLLIPFVSLIVLVMVLPWFWHMYKISGSPVGSNSSLLHFGVGGLTGNEIFCTLNAPQYEQLFKDASQKEWMGFDWHFEHAWTLLGANPLVILFAVSILHNFKRRRAQALRWFLLGAALCLVAANNLCVPQPEALDPWNVLVLLLPGMLVVGAAFLCIMISRLNLELWLLDNMIVIVVILLTALPLARTVTTVSNSYYNYPPYNPPYLKRLGAAFRPDEWITTDMPWATAWYTGHASLWLPDKVNDFDLIYDNYCPSGGLLLTPVLLSKPATDLTTGEYKDWLPFISGGELPPHFPLSGRVPMAPGNPYAIWVLPSHLR